MLLQTQLGNVATFCLKYPLLVPQTQLEHFPTSWKKISIGRKCKKKLFSLFLGSLPQLTVTPHDKCCRNVIMFHADLNRGSMFESYV